MNRKTFLSSLLTLSASPLIPAFKTSNSVSVPKVIVVCYGPSGRRVWSHLVYYRKTDAMFPLMIDSFGAFHFIRKTIKPKQIIIVSRLEDTLLSKTLIYLSLSRMEENDDVMGYFTYPYSDPQTNLVANTNLRKTDDCMRNVRLINHPDYGDQKIRPRWPLEWFDDKMDESEKQIVWELLRREERKDF